MQTRTLQDDQGQAPRLVLASASPRRADLLRAAGIDFDVLSADIDEAIAPGELAEEYVRRVARQKVDAVHLVAPGRPILGAFHGFMSGHALNNKLARALLRCEDAWEIVTYDVQQPEPIMHPAAVSASS